jgi:hypothetical protein
LVQLVPYGRNHTNPAVQSEPPWDNPQTKALFERACADCHSHQTVWPWYSQIAPVAWLVQYDVDQGRKRLNLSAWKQQRQYTDNAGKLIWKGQMPPRHYVLLHPQARLSPSQRSDLIHGLEWSLLPNSP